MRWVSKETYKKRQERNRERLDRASEPEMLLSGAWKLSIHRKAAGAELAVLLRKDLSGPVIGQPAVRHAEKELLDTQGNIELSSGYVTHEDGQELRIENPSAITALLKHFTQRKKGARGARETFAISIFLEDIDPSLFNREKRESLEPTPELKQCLDDCNINGKTVSLLSGSTGRAQLVAIKEALKRDTEKNASAEYTQGLLFF